MKARVIATGEIVTIMKNIGCPGGYVASNGRTYHDEDLTLIVNEDPDYWTRLEHQYTGQFMQAMISSSNYIDVSEEAMADASFRMAHALLEKKKKEE